MFLSFRKTVRLCLLAGAIALSMVPLSIQAQQPGQPPKPGQQSGQPGQPPAGQLTTQQFQANPDQVLTKFPNGGGEMIAQIRELTLADHANLTFVLLVLAKANN